MENQDGKSDKVNNSLGVCHGKIDIGAEPGPGVDSNDDDDIATETEDTNSSIKRYAECQVGSDSFCSILNIKYFLSIRTNLNIKCFISIRTNLARLNAHTHKSIIF